MVLLCNIITHLNPKLASSSVTFPMLNAPVALGVALAVATCLVVYGKISNISNQSWAPTFIREVTPRFHNRDLEHSLLLEEWVPF